jgi:asparagine synthase (glutamine-hydrolysing)
MCGFYFTSKVTNRTFSDFDKASHRGPDDHSYIIKNGCFFGHHRLAIIDCSSEANQPMTFDNLALLFNGEIYNYIELRNDLLNLGYEFKTDSDTEVLLKAYHCYKESIFKKIDGMFAICIYDSNDDSIVLARDAAGEKPLFYNLSNGVKASSYYFSLNPCFNNYDAVINHYLKFGYVKEGKTFDRNIFQILPGEFLKIDTETVQIIQRGSFSFDIKRLQNEPVDYDEVWQRIKMSVDRRRLADVPLGFFLSSGMDSSLLVAAASEVASKVTTLTFTQDDKRYDESIPAKYISQYFDTEHIEIAFPKERQNLQSLMSHLDIPLGDSSFIPTKILMNGASAHVKAVIGGDGGDEVFGGYKRYSRFVRNENVNIKIPQFILNKLPRWIKGRESVINAYKSHNIISNYTPYFNFIDRAVLLKGSGVDFVERERTHFKSVSELVDCDRNNLLCSCYLPKVDRASMSAGIEVRLPYLNRGLVESVGRFSIDHSVSAVETRKIQRSLCEKKLPSSVLKIQKKGLSFDYTKHLAEEDFQLVYKFCLKYDMDIKYLDWLVSNLSKNTSKFFALFSLAVFENKHGK